MINRTSFTLILPIGLLFFLVLSSQWNSIAGNVDCLEDEGPGYKAWDTSVDEKQRGAHVFSRFDTANFEYLTRNNIEWVTLVSWAYQDDVDSPILRHHSGDSIQMRKTDSSWIARINLIRDSGLKVFVKPHIWISDPSDGKWRSDVFPGSTDHWEEWKNGYRDYIHRYARIAEKTNAEMFCVGTELSMLSVEKSAFWESLIQEIRSIYSGKITYAANWYDEYEHVSFWEHLDYIGIQAYFPLVKNKYPSIEQISKGWNRYLPTLESIHKRYNRKILFTEMGYKSTADSAIKPWEWLEDPSLPEKSFSLETQTNCYVAFFDKVWHRDWFAGVHIWQIRDDYREWLEMPNLDFIPMGKPAEKIIAEAFKVNN